MLKKSFSLENKMNAIHVRKKKEIEEKKLTIKKRINGEREKNS